MRLVIYGAQGMAFGAFEAIQNIYPRRNIDCFLVTRREGNAERLAGIPVIELQEYAQTCSYEEKENMEVLIATPENVMPDIEKSLEEYGFHYHARLTSDRWAELMCCHHVRNGKFLPLAALPIGCRKAGMHVFMAKSCKDKRLVYACGMPEWITPVQAGAALCRERAADILDCDGENISEKNVNYSELTVLYWMWKNRLVYKSPADHSEYYGLVHYRRILGLSEDDIYKLVDNAVDAVLPYPMPYEPDMEAHHERYIKAADWNALLAAVQELQPEYAARMREILKQPYLYNYNIMLARKSVLEQYCSWLFPILGRVEELSTPKGCDRTDRYIGYLGETLATLYFMANREKLNITHVGCRFLT